MTRLRSRRWTTIGASLAAFVAVLGGVAVIAHGEEGGGGSRPLVITAEAQRRTLVDELTLRGTVGRVEQRQVDAAVPGRVSAVHVDDGAVVEPGQQVLSLDGRASVAAVGDFPFYRDLDVGARGDDVRQLERILQAAGFPPGPVDDLYTTETRIALAGWQGAQGYPAASNEPSETVSISLGQGAGYRIGDEGGAGVVISAAAADPLLTLRALDAVVAEGAAARFEITADDPPDVATEVTVAIAEPSVDDEDVLVPTVPVVLPADAWSVTFTIPVRQDDLVEGDERLRVQLVDDTGYRAAAGTADLVIVSDDVPQVQLLGGGGVAEGDAGEVVVVADQAPVRDVQVGLAFGGEATAGDDYDAPPPAVVLRAGSTRVEVPVATRTDDTIEDEERVVVSLGAPTGAYRLGRQTTAVVTIGRADGAAAVPSVSMRPTVTDVAEGQPVTFVVALSGALTDDLELALAYGGSAVVGDDYVPAPGRVLVPAGRTSFELQVPTVDDDRVEQDRTLTVSLRASDGYALGSPASGTVVLDSDDVPELRVVGAGGSVGEGGRRGFSIVADQAPVSDVAVAYQVLGSATPGQDFEALTGFVLLRAGELAVTVPLATLADDVAFRSTDMIVGDWPTRIGQVLVEDGDSVAAGTPLISLTDTGLTVTLRASATDRTELEPGQQVTVRLAGGLEEATGTISELDETASVDPETQEQYYEGTVDVAELAAADGAAVTIDVLLDERADAVTVPIAAVKQDGTGQDVVRVIDLAGDGEITEVPVQTGIAEGSYIEVREGLSGGEVVVVEVDQAQ